MIIKKSLFSLFLLTFNLYLYGSGIVVGEIRGSFKDNYFFNKFHGYFVLIENLEDDFVPVTTGLTNKFNKRKLGYLTTTSTWAQNVDAFIAVNANFFDPESEYKPNDLRQMFGPVKVQGKEIAPILIRPDGKGNPALLFDINNKPSIKMANIQDLKDSYTAIGAQWEKNPDLGYNGSLLIENGLICADTTLPVPYEVAPRTAIGLDQDNKIMLILVIEGRLKDNAGITLPELAKIMKSFGMYNAINFDGGGSSTISYVPSTNIPLHESLQLYQMLKTCKLKTSKNDTLLFSIKQLDPRIPFSSQPSGGGTFESATKEGKKMKEELDENPKIESNQIYRPVAVNFGLKIKHK